MTDQVRPRVLFAEDVAEFREQIGSFLERSNFNITAVSDGEAAIGQIQASQFDVIILDNQMPRKSGRDVMRYLAANRISTPVIFLSDFNEVADKVGALEDGADDYLAKPCDKQELLARIKVVLRRRQTVGPALDAARYLVSGELTVDKSARKVQVRGQPVKLTTKAFDLLMFLMKYPEMTLTRSQILDNVWGYTAIVSDRNVIDTRIAELRSVLGDDRQNPRYIDTVQGVGYKFIGKLEGRT